jgi:TRAP-type C4-dicarboxylate transport system substrate-binding protein
MRMTVRAGAQPAAASGAAAPTPIAPRHAALVARAAAPGGRPSHTHRNHPAGNERSVVNQRLVQALAAGAVAALPLAAGAAEPIELKFGFPPPTTTPYYGANAVPWTKAVEEGSGGAVKITYFPGGTVANFRNVYDRVVNGVVDFGWGALQDMGSQFPRTDVGSLPFETDTATQTSVALWRIYANGVTAQEFSGIHLLGLWGFPTNALHSTKPITKPDDMKGVKVLVQTGMLGQAMSLYGATPVSLTIAEMYEALQRGTASALISGWTAVAIYKMHEVTKYHLDLPLGTSIGYQFMNKASYAKLPEAARKAIDTASGEVLSRAMGVTSDRTGNGTEQHIGQLPGQQLTKIDAAEIEQWKRVLAPVTQDWVKKTPDGAKVLAAFRTEVAKLKTEK